MSVQFVYVFISSSAAKRAKEEEEKKATLLAQASEYAKVKEVSPFNCFVIIFLRKIRKKGKGQDVYILKTFFFKS